LCSICSEGVSIFKEYSIARHYNSKHKEKYKNGVGALTREKLAILKRGDETK
jgi:hypothetical protein